MSDLNAEKFIENWYGEQIPKGWDNDYEPLRNLSITELKQMLIEFAEQKENGATTGEKQCNLPVVVCSNCPKVIGLTVGKSYTQLAKHKDIIALVNDYGDMKRYNIAYFE